MNRANARRALRDRVEQIESSKDFRIGEIDFHPFTIPHDAVDNFGFTATHQGVKIATLMDFGHITTLISEQLRGCAAIVIESNHSRDMLKACDTYPWELKQRILSRLGHLSNEDVADWIRDGFDGVARFLVLAHLSQRANNPYLAKISAEVALAGALSAFSCRHADQSVISEGADSVDRGVRDRMSGMRVGRSVRHLSTQRLMPQLCTTSGYVHCLDAPICAGLLLAVLALRARRIASHECSAGSGIDD